MTYEIKLSKKALKYLSKVPEPKKSKIKNKIRELQENPQSHPFVKYMENSPYYRLRIGDYRVIFEVVENELLILVIKIGTRGDVYKG